MTYFIYGDMGSEVNMDHQRLYLWPAIERVWSGQQAALIDQVRNGGEVVLGGDGRCDSPGHSSKYCSYTLMDLERNQILEMALVQVGIRCEVRFLAWLKLSQIML